MNTKFQLSLILCESDAVKNLSKVKEMFNSFINELEEICPDSKIEFTKEKLSETKNDVCMTLTQAIEKVKNDNAGKNLPIAEIAKIINDNQYCGEDTISVERVAVRNSQMLKSKDSKILKQAINSDKNYKTQYKNIVDILKGINDLYTFEEYKYRNLTFDLDSQGGIYFAIKDDKYSDLDLLEKPDGPTSYKGKKIELKDEHVRKFRKFKELDDEIIYFGKAQDLKKRIELYIDFMFDSGNTLVRHHGGYPILFIKNHKSKLKLGYVTLSDFIAKLPDFYNVAVMIDKKTGTNDLAETLEAGLFELHKLVYDDLPLTNSKDANLDLRYQWKKYWMNGKLDF